MYDNLTAPISINQVKYGAMFAIAIFSCSEFKTNTKFIKGENIMSVTSNDDVISVLNNLIETCRDGQNGFQAAAEGITQTEVKKLFAQYAQQRAQFVGELQGMVRTLGGDPENTGSIAAALHRGWINIKAVVTGKDEHNILEECERGEDSAKKNYEDALKENLPGDVVTSIRHQYEAVREAHDRIRSLRDRTETATA